MSDKLKKPFVKSFVSEWGDVSAQSNMLDPENQYNHISKHGKKVKPITVGEHVLIRRGKDNHAPQKDIELGKKSATHKIISSKMAKLVAGKGVKFRMKDKEVEEGFSKAFIQEGEELLDKGLRECIADLANGMVYHSLADLIVTQDVAKYNPKKDAVNSTINYISSQPSERLRFAEGIMTEKATTIVPYHYYHEDWGFTGDCRKNTKTPKIIDIKDYIAQSKSGDKPKEAFYVHTNEHPLAKTVQHVSFKVAGDSGIFDTAYPLPKWKSNSAINDIQNEFEASCIRTDFLMNGLHVFAIVNVYSMRFNVNTTNDDETPDEDWADSLEVVKNLKRSSNSGKVIVNAIATSDPEMDGVTKVEKIDTSFPADVYEKLTNQSADGVLTAWGVNYALFGISKDGGAGLTSQEGFMKVGVLMLEEDVSIMQNNISSSINKMLEFYGMTEIECYFEKNDNNLYLSMMADIAQNFMKVNDIRTKILGEKEYDEENLKLFIEERKELNNKQVKTKIDE